MEIIDTHKSILENLYFLSGPILAVLGLFIFRQIKLAKNQFIIAKKQLEESQKQLKINSQRQAASLAADKVKEYCSELLPLIDRISIEKEKIKYVDFTGPIMNFTNDELKNFDKEFLDAFLNRPIEIAFLELEIINNLEAFSVYFVKGIADEKIAFNSIGKTFCNSILQYYPTISLLRGSKNANKPYDTLIQLYRCWSERLDSFKIETEKEELSKEVQNRIDQLEQLKKRRPDFDNLNVIGIE